jgi:hypothetical protein
MVYLHFRFSSHLFNVVYSQSLKDSRVSDCKNLNSRPGNIYLERISNFERTIMCRNIKPLFNFQPAASSDEIEAAALQFVRKISGFTKPSKANEAAFELAVEQTAAIAKTLLDSLVTNAQPKDRVLEIAKLRQKAAIRFRAQRQEVNSSST